MRAETDKKTIKTLLIADDHPLFRQALTYIAESHFTLNEIIHTASHDETIEKLNTNDIDWLFLDLNMPGSDGINTLSTIRKNFPKLPIIIVSANESQEIVSACFKHNIAGFIGKSTPPGEIDVAIEKIIQGEQHSPDFDPSTSSSDSKIDQLTASQLNILFQIGMGKLNKQIAADLNVTEATIKAHITQIYKKLNINNRTQAALIAKKISFEH